MAGTSLQNNKFIPIPTDPGVLIGLKSGSISTSNPIFQPLTGTGYEAKSVATVGSNPNSEFIFTIVTVMLKNPSTGNPGTSTDPVHLNVGAMHGASVDYSKSGVFVTISRANGAVETDLVMLPAHGSYCVNSFPYIISGNNVCLTSGSMDHKPATTLSTKLSDMKDIPGVKISDQYTTTSSNLDMGTGYQLEHASLGYMTDMIFAIKNKPATMGTVVAQMPTTGAPTGNMEADLMGTIISLLGGLVMLIRRRLS